MTRRAVAVLALGLALLTACGEEPCRGTAVYGVDEDGEEFSRCEPDAPRSSSG